MKEYIDKEAYCKNRCLCNSEHCDKEKCSVWLAPAADVVEVRHGRWKPTMTSKTVSFYLAPGWKCSCCGHEIEDKSEKLHYPKNLKYCWNCGAKMDKEEKET